ncbi:hypothetical protein [Rudanella lutea]|uniref:hypothetical protein n=1 Tax=Rudanella lutea TaxID=451374 RepID=UPI00146A35EE|nr:hypothetical protein [Rudanella lutea]
MIDQFWRYRKRIDFYRSHHGWTNKRKEKGDSNSFEQNIKLLGDREVTLARNGLVY